MAARHRRNLHAQLATRGLSGHCYFDSDGNFCCPGPNGIECTGPSGTFTQRTPWQAGPILPPRTPDWPTKLAYASNPGPVNPFPYPGPDVIVSEPIDPFARARAQQARRRRVARAAKSSRYNTIRRVLGL